MNITGNKIRSILISGIITIVISSSNLFAQMNMDSTTTKSGMSDDEMKSQIEKRASDLTSDLQSKVGLNEMQVSTVKSNLIDYMTKIATLQATQRAGLKESPPIGSNPPSPSMPNSDIAPTGVTDEMKSADSDASLKIESVITEYQKEKWSNIKDTWWGEVKSVVYNNSMGK